MTSEQLLRWLLYNITIYDIKSLSHGRVRIMNKGHGHHRKRGPISGAKLEARHRHGGRGKQRHKLVSTIRFGQAGARRTTPGLAYRLAMKDPGRIRRVSDREVTGLQERGVASAGYKERF